MNSDKVPFFVPAFFLLIVLLFSGCEAEKSTILTLNYIETLSKPLLNNQQEIYAVPVILPESIKEKNYKIGSWQRFNNQRENYFLGENVRNLFGAGLTKALDQRGFSVLKAEGWNLEPEGLSVFDKNIIALKLEQFETMSTSDAVKVKSEFLLKVTGFLGVPSENRVHRATVSLQSTPINLTISNELVEKELSELFSEGIRRVVNQLLSKVDRDVFKM